jgi:hypothetical protein
MRGKLRLSCRGEMRLRMQAVSRSHGDIIVTSLSRSRLGVQNERREECG